LVLSQQGSHGIDENDCGTLAGNNIRQVSLVVDMEHRTVDVGKGWLDSKVRADWKEVYGKVGVVKFHGSL
jgi:hypothetical protein